jgi:hypothetical protein
MCNTSILNQNLPSVMYHFYTVHNFDWRTVVPNVCHDLTSCVFLTLHLQRNKIQTTNTSGNHQRRKKKYSEYIHKLKIKHIVPTTNQFHVTNI